MLLRKTIQDGAFLFWCDDGMLGLKFSGEMLVREVRGWPGCFELSFSVRYPRDLSRIKRRKGVRGQSATYVIRKCVI